MKIRLRTGLPEQSFGLRKIAVYKGKKKKARFREEPRRKFWEMLRLGVVGDLAVFGVIETFRFDFLADTPASEAARDDPHDQ